MQKTRGSWRLHRHIYIKTTKKSRLRRLPPRLLEAPPATSLQVAPARYSQARGAKPARRLSREAEPLFFLHAKNSRLLEAPPATRKLASGACPLLASSRRQACQEAQPGGPSGSLCRKGNRGGSTRKLAGPEGPARRTHLLLLLLQHISKFSFMYESHHRLLAFLSFATLLLTAFFHLQVHSARRQVGYLLGNSEFGFNNGDKKCIISFFITKK